MENQNYKNENIEREFLNNCKKKTIFKGKEQSFRMRIKRQRKKIKREMEELFFKPIIVSKDDMDRFEKKKK